MRTRLRTHGFTLIELMIVVAIIGLLAAIAIPAMVGYTRRARASETFANLQNLSEGAAAYYTGERWGARTIDPTPGVVSHVTGCTVGAATTSNVPGNHKSVLDWNAESASFREIGFTTRDPVAFQYEIAGGSGACGNPANTPLYSFRANGDLDGDGVTSLYELSAGSNRDNELMRSPGFYILNPLE